MNTYEFTFGVVPCLVATEGTPSTATMYVIVNDGAALRPITEREGEPIRLTTTQEMDSLGRAVGYLQTRFGERGNPIVWAKPWWYLGRTIFTDAPLIEGEPLT